MQNDVDCLRASRQYRSYGLRQRRWLEGGTSMSDLIRISRRGLLASGAKAIAATAAVGIAPRLIRPSRAFAADALGPNMIGGPTGFEGSERYQYGADTPEGRAIEAAKTLKGQGVDRIVLGLSDGSI